MKQIPRYDTASDDPHSLKAALSQLFNDTLVQLWLGSPLKERISIGSHSLECNGGIRDSRYRLKNRFDGIHMYGVSGRKAYTESVLKIVRDAGLINSPPPIYFRRFHMAGKHANPSHDEKYNCPTEETDWMNDKDIRGRKTAFKYAVPTSNRFAQLNQKN